MASSVHGEEHPAKSIGCLGSLITNPVIAIASPGNLHHASTVLSKSHHPTQSVWTALGASLRAHGSTRTFKSTVIHLVPAA